MDGVRSLPGVLRGYRYLMVGVMAVFLVVVRDGLWH